MLHRPKYGEQPDVKCSPVTNTPTKCTVYLKYTAHLVLIDFSLTVEAATLIFISGRGSVISCTKEGKSDYIYNLVKN